jgi:hypothetical protein
LEGRARICQDPTRDAQEARQDSLIFKLRHYRQITRWRLG